MANISKLDKEFNIIKNVTITGTANGLVHKSNGKHFYLARFISGTNSAIQHVYIDWTAGTVRQVNTLVSTALSTRTYRDVATDKKFIYYWRRDAGPPIDLRLLKVDVNNSITRTILTTATSNFWGVSKRWTNNKMLLTQQVGGVLIGTIKIAHPNGNIIKSITVTDNPAGITYDRKYIYYVDNVTSIIYKLDVKGFTIRASTALSFVPNAITTDGKYLYVAGA